MHYWLVMPAAGSGRRFGKLKQQAPLATRTVLELALQPFIDDGQCRGGTLALAPAHEGRAELERRLAPRFQCIEGGAERAHSVLRALQALERAAAEDWVLVHDAARPCLSSADLGRLLAAGAQHPVGALLAVPLADTLRRAADRLAAAEGTAQSATTLSREGLWLAQTPQMFRYQRLRAALEAALAAGRTPTDEAQAMEWQGQAALLVEARDPNPKITKPSDLTIAAAILSARQETGGDA
jgi:2-C-methyl-D-erythritol 4-phosphate cytidylyltransferase